MLTDSSWRKSHYAKSARQYLKPEREPRRRTAQDGDSEDDLPIRGDSVGYYY